MRCLHNNEGFTPKEPDYMWSLFKGHSTYRFGARGTRIVTLVLELVCAQQPALQTMGPFPAGHSLGNGEI